MTDGASRIAFLCDDADGFIGPNGEPFFGHIELHGPLERRMLESGAWWSAQEAVDWGRSRADVVVIRVGNPSTTYSAGVAEPEGEPRLPRWPG